MMISDIRDYIASLGIAEHVYMGKLPDKQDKSIGAYSSKHQHTYKTAIGGPALESYGTYYATLLVHWDKSPRNAEVATKTLFDALTEVRNVTINNQLIKFIQPLYEPQPVGTDDDGVYEWVIEMAVVHAK